jgi:hypothetical protein
MIVLLCTSGLCTVGGSFSIPLIELESATVNSKSIAQVAAESLARPITARPKFCGEGLDEGMSSL